MDTFAQAVKGTDWLGAVTDQRKGERSTTPRRAAYLLGVVLLSGCLGASFLLVLERFDQLELLGCGHQSDCAEAASSAWGTVPGAAWPLSFVGFAYFQALTAAFIYTGGQLPLALRWIVGLGAAISALLTVVMFAEGYVCLYCLTIHGMNLSFAAGTELLRRLSGGQQHVARNSWPGIITFTASCAFVTLVLAYFERHSVESAGGVAEQQLQQALDAAAATVRTGSTQQGDPSNDVEPPARDSFQPGRYSLGSETAPIHIVVVSDYQCPSCRRFDLKLRELVAQRDDIRLSARHFPFCTDCNPLVRDNRHPHACRAALAAEAAGMVGGATAFWQLHEWLFDRGGTYSDEELQQLIADMGLDEQEFAHA
ncbi:MAG: DsbA family protein, partial [Bythopirellula sp.]